MSDKITESDIENMAIDLLVDQGFSYSYGPTLSSGSVAERSSTREVILLGRLRQAVQRLNPNLPAAAQADAIQTVLDLSPMDLIAANELFHHYLTNGIEVEFQQAGQTLGDKAWLFDFANPAANDCLVVNQLTVCENQYEKRPDLVLFINGLPLVVFELKNPADAQATLHSAYLQLLTYKESIPSLFIFNSVLIASDGLQARVGSLSADYARFMAWKSADGVQEAPRLTGELEVLIAGLLAPATLLDLTRHFTVFDKSRRQDSKTGLTVIESVKKIAAYHQFYAVRKAVASTLVAAASSGNQKAGVIWHTQGSGKSLSMVFYAGKLVLALDNPTLVILTDRNDLDDQLFDTFAASRHLLRQEPVQAHNRDELRDLLQVASGGVIFTTLQKFAPKSGEAIYPLLSDRRNIVVIADEAHRSQYGFKAREVDIKDADGRIVGKKTAYGFAKYVRDALPQATFIGFTGTPIEHVDKNTPAVFGDYIDIYDIAQAVEDGATVGLFYEGRLAKLHLKSEHKATLDQAVLQVQEEAAQYQNSLDDVDALSAQAQAKWTRQEAMAGHPQRINNVARDMVVHFEARRAILLGKGLFVAMSRRVCVALYDAIVTLRPDWHSLDDTQGVIKVVITGSSADSRELQVHTRNKAARKAIGERLKDPDDKLQLVIVCDMWLTGFDAPCLHTLYIDKPMHGHSLMQAIARVNRVYKDKTAGLVVDYIGIATHLQQAMATYTASGGKGQPALDFEQAILAMQEKFEVVDQMLAGSGYQDYFSAGTADKLTILRATEDYILGLDDGKARFGREVGLLTKAFALAVPDPRALKIKEALAFYQTVQACLAKFDRSGQTYRGDLDSAIRQLVDEAVISDQVVDIFDAAGVKKPDIALLSAEFLAEVREMPQRNLAFELLKKILSDEIRTRSQHNLVHSRSLSEMLEDAIHRYQNNLLTAAEVIDVLIDMAKQIKAANQRGEALNLTKDEMAFYDALGVSDSAVAVLGDDQLREIARELVEKVKKNATLDWTVKENVRARLRAHVRRTLNRYGYPPDKQITATETILQQAELSAKGWTNQNHRLKLPDQPSKPVR